MTKKSSNNGDQPVPRNSLTREEAHARLEAAGLLANLANLDIQEELDWVTDEEIERAGSLAPGARSSDEIIDEDRGLH